MGYFDHHTGKPVQAVIDRYVTVLRACKTQRPDLVLGYYSVVPLAGSWAYTNPKPMPLTDELNAALKSIAEVADFVAPSFYVNFKDFNLEHTLRWMREVIAACKKHYPGKPIIPFLWPQWGDVRNAIDEQAAKERVPQSGRTPGFKFTPKQVDKANIPGKIWRALLEQLTACGVKEIILWGDGYYPWNDNAPWLMETLEWRNMRN